MKDLSTSSKIIGGAIVTAGAAALVVGSNLWAGFVLKSLWNWFAFPFTEVKLGLALAIGLSCLISYFRGTRYTPKVEGDDTGARVLHAFLAPGLLLLVGWVAQQFVGAA